MMEDSNKLTDPDNFVSLTRESERILSDILGSQIHFIKVERLSEPERRNLILRCISDPNSTTPSSFIIKKVEANSYNPADPNSWDSQRFFSDWAGSQFLSSLGSGKNHGPHFYGGNRDLGFIILEDMGHHRSLVDPLLHKDAGRATSALLRYSTRLGKMHADTFNQQSLFNTLLHSVNPIAKSFEPTEKDLEEGFRKVQTILTGLGIDMEYLFSQEFQRIISTVLNPGPFLVYIHGDPCPDNVFDNNDEIRLIDFEFGHFGHALIDATYGRMMFPTCWCANRLPESIVTQMEDRYRAELVQGCPQAQEDRVFEEALVTICGFWLLITLVRHLEHALEEDQNWGVRVSVKEFKLVWKRS